MAFCVLAVATSELTLSVFFDDFIGSLRAEMGQACPAILLGGRAINALDDIWRDLGADLWVADAEQAEQQAKRFGVGADDGAN